MGCRFADLALIEDDHPTRGGQFDGGAQSGSARSLTRKSVCEGAHFFLDGRKMVAPIPGGQTVTMSKL